VRKRRSTGKPARLRRAALALALAAASAAMPAGAADGRQPDEGTPPQRLIRVDTPWWRRVLGSPKLLVDAFHWPLKKFLVWGEDVRIDRRVRNAILWKDNDDLPIAEPTKDTDGDHVWWDYYRNVYLYRLDRLVDPAVEVAGALRSAHIAAPEEAVNVNLLDEVPDSSWSTNRHARSRLARDALARGPNEGPPPSPDGPLVVLSGKELGTQPGFWIRDAAGRRYLVKFDPRGYPDLATGAELVSSKILYALGWNVAEYHLFSIRPDRLTIDEHAWILDPYARKRPLTRDDLDRILATAEHAPDGSIRALASRLLPGVIKGGFRMFGVRGDDPNDTIPHEERRDLRGLRVVCAWLDHVDFRSGNTLDTFIRDPGDDAARGHLVHYLIDLNGTLGSWGTGWKERWIGHEYVDETLPALARALHVWRPGWADEPLLHRSLGYFEAEHFRPERWKTLYFLAPFDRATIRDDFWGARLVASMSAENLRTVVGAAEWSDPSAADLLVRVLRDRQRKIAEAYFDPRRINPLDELEVEGGELRFRDLRVSAGIVESASARYRVRIGDSPPIVVASTDAPLGATAAPLRVRIETSYDGGASWSPPLTVTVDTDEGAQRVSGIERTTRW
jgi:hypothetical protein